MQYVCSCHVARTLLKLSDSESYINNFGEGSLPSLTKLSLILVNAMTENQIKLIKLKIK